MIHSTVAVALSGGIDSLVAGHLVKKKCNNVFGINFVTGYEKKPADVSRLSRQLGFEVFQVDLSDDFERLVVQYFTTTYLLGKTPNPCLICNKAIKFGALFSAAQDLGADLLATGHYAGVYNRYTCPKDNSGSAYLKKGADVKKDQSYFLALLSSKQLEKVFFPLSGLNKKQVRTVAAEAGITPLHADESQDICFVRDRTFSDFIIEKKKLTPAHGDIVNTNGQILGRHKGLHRFTIGQRRGIDCPAEEPYYVKAIDIKHNRLIVCFKSELRQKEFAIHQINWNDTRKPIISQISTRIRYSHQAAGCTLHLENDHGRVVFDDPQHAVTPGQAAVFYREQKILGAGIIT